MHPWPQLGPLHQGTPPSLGEKEKNTLKQTKKPPRKPTKQTKGLPHRSIPGRQQCHAGHGSLERQSSVGFLPASPPARAAPFLHRTWADYTDRASRVTGVRVGTYTTLPKGRDRTSSQHRKRTRHRTRKGQPASHRPSHCTFHQLWIWETWSPPAGKPPSWAPLPSVTKTIRARLRVMGTEVIQRPSAGHLPAPRGGGGPQPLKRQALPAGLRCADAFDDGEQLTVGQSVCDLWENEENKNLLTAEAVSGPVIWRVITETPGTETESTVFWWGFLHSVLYYTFLLSFFQTKTPLK